MGSTGSPFNLPYPEEGDFADVPEDMRALAEAVARELANFGLGSAVTTVQNGLTTVQNGLTALTTRVTNIEAVKGAGWTTAMTLAAVFDRIPTAKARYGFTSVTCDANGRGYVPHGLGVKPSMFMATAGVPGSTKRAINVTIDWDDTTTTNAAFWAWDDENNKYAANQVVHLHWMARA